MENLQEMVKYVVSNFKGETVCKLLHEDSDYQNVVFQAEAAAKAYKSLELSDEQRNIVDKLLSTQEDVQEEYSINTYMAGLLDSYNIFQSFGLIRE